MSGFSAEWLAFREPVDAASRNPGITARLLAWRRRYAALAVLDLGGGTGANVRFLAPLLGGEQRWRLVEHDPALLAHGEALFRRWAAERGMAAGWFGFVDVSPGGVPAGTPAETGHFLPACVQWNK